MVLHLQNFDIIRIIFPQADQCQHQTGEDSLYGFLFVAGSGEGQGDSCVILFDPNFGLCATYIIDGGFGHGDSSRDGGTDDVGTCLSITAVTADGKSGDPVVSHEKFASSHNYRAILVISTLV